MPSVAGVDASDESPTSVPEALGGHARIQAPACLDPLDRRHLERMLRAERVLPAFLWANLVVAAILVLSYSWSNSWSGIRAVLVLLILMAARAHLRQLRSARLLRKLCGPGPTSC